MPMIRKVTLKNFKRFEDVSFDIHGHLVLAGPNNTGKTTVLQAIAAWALGLLEWRKLARPALVNRRVGYAWADLERLAFDAVALRSFELLWRNRQTRESLLIGLQFEGANETLTFEFRFVGAGLVRTRPVAATPPAALAALGEVATVFIPPIGGIKRTELRLADDIAIRNELAQGRASEVLRNLLVRAHDRDGVWPLLNEVMGRLFSVQLDVPRRGAELLCEYRAISRQTGQLLEPAFDLASAGSGMLQVLLVLSLMLTQRGSVLLVDEPDAHLHLILQKSIYTELKALAVRTGSQLMVATHSEKIIESVADDELCMMYGTPRPVQGGQERRRVIDALGWVSHADLLEVADAAGVMYAEDFTDFDILEAFARVLGDGDALALLTARLVRKHTQSDRVDGIAGVNAQRHWEYLKLAAPQLPGLELRDGDTAGERPIRVTGQFDQLQRLIWPRCEIESYLLQPSAIRRFFERKLGADAEGVDAAMRRLAQDLGEDFDPRAPDLGALQKTYLRSEKVSETLLPAVVRAAGLNDFQKRDFFEIAASFQPDEVAADVVEALALLKFAFGAGPDPRIVVPEAAGGDHA
jgi:ABC-type branched-subunit amino acid transport system ATPase component